MFLGENLLAWLLLALGGALCVGNLLALVRPPQPPRDPGHEPDQDQDRLERAPLARSLVYAALGALAAIWALATLLA